MHAVPATKRITAAEYLAPPCPEERRPSRLGEDEGHVELLEAFGLPLSERFRAIE